MQVTFKTFTEEELKAYEGNHGFVFQSKNTISDTSIERMCQDLIDHVTIAKGEYTQVETRITDEFPQFVQRLDDKTLLFVYGDNFNMPLFLRKADVLNRTGLMKIEAWVNVFKS